MYNVVEHSTYIIDYKCVTEPHPPTCTTNILVIWLLLWFRCATTVTSGFFQLGSSFTRLAFWVFWASCCWWLLINDDATSVHLRLLFVNQNSSQRVREVAKCMNFRASKADCVFSGRYTLTNDQVWPISRFAICQFTACSKDGFSSVAYCIHFCHILSIFFGRKRNKTLFHSLVKSKYYCLSIENKNRNSWTWPVKQNFCVLLFS